MYKNNIKTQDIFVQGYISHVEAKSIYLYIMQVKFLSALCKDQKAYMLRTDRQKD